MGVSLRVFHDESEPKPWFVTGLLWLELRDLTRIADCLASDRANPEYTGEVHFKLLGKDYRRTMVAKRWFNRFQTGKLRGLKVSVMVVDKRPRIFKPGYFTEKFHEYNRFTAMALHSSFKWFWRDVQSSTIHIYSDKKERRSPKVMAPDGVTTDNFEEYLRKRFESDANPESLTESLDGQQGYQTHEIKLVRLVDSGKPAPSIELKRIHDLLQLCDLLTGAFAQSFSGAATNPIKRHFGFEANRMIGHIEPASKQPDWELRGRLHLGVFPDENGRFRKTLYPLASRRRVRKLDDFPVAP
jgi:hypothetical protein